HTRFSRDWSSDVCSSDLEERIGRNARRQLAAVTIENRSAAGANLKTGLELPAFQILEPRIGHDLHAHRARDQHAPKNQKSGEKRSEERRGGEEGRRGERA